MCREDAFSFCVYNEPNASLDRFVLAQGSVQTRIWRMYIIELLSEMVYREPGIYFTRFVLAQGSVQTRIWRMYIIELLSEMMYREPGVTFTKCIFSHTLPHTKEKENGGMRQ